MHRFVAPAGYLWLSGTNVIDGDPEADPVYPDAQQSEVDDLPTEALQFLLPSRYCLVDQFGALAQDLFGSYPKAGDAVAIRDYVDKRVTFNYNAARRHQDGHGCLHGARRGSVATFSISPSLLPAARIFPPATSQATSVTFGGCTAARATSALRIRSLLTASGSIWTPATTIADLEGS